MSLLLKKLDEALSSNKINLSAETKRLTKEYIKSRRNFTSLIETATKGMTQAGYLKLTPVKLDRELLFGPHAPSNYAHELTLFPAIHVDGEWKADELNPIFKALISERALSNALFNHQKYNGQQCTFTELNGCKTDNYEPTFSSAEELEKFEVSERDNAIHASKNLMELCKQLREPDFKIQKEFRAQALHSLKALNNYARGDLEFSMNLAREKLEKNLGHVRSEIVTSLTGLLQDIATPFLALEDKSKDPKTSPLHALFHSQNQDAAQYAGMTKTIQSYEPFLSGKESEALNSFINKSTSKSIIQSSNGAQNCKGMIKISQYSGHRGFSFGDTTELGEWFGFNFSFATETLDEFGDIRFRGNRNFAEVGLSQFQLLELIQGSHLSGRFVKCTISNYLMTRLDEPAPELSHDELAPTGKKSYKKNPALENALLELEGLINKKSQAKAHKALICQKAEDLAGLIEDEGNSRMSEFNAEGQALTEKFYEHHAKCMVEIVESVSGKRPDIAEKINSLLRLRK